MNGQENTTTTSRLSLDTTTTTTTLHTPISSSASSCILQSGGAQGADTHFELCAHHSKHQVRKFVFETQFILCPNNLVILTSRDLEQASVFVLDAAKTLKRSIGKNDYTRNLLRRNYFQIRDATSVFAVSNFESTTTATASALMRRTRDVGIHGGTAWACQMFVNQYYKTYGANELVHSTDATSVPLYLFDQTSQKWFQCQLVGPTTGFVEWRQLNRPPTLPSEGVYAGIGSRQLTSAGQRAIDALYQTPTVNNNKKLQDPSTT